MAVFIGAIKKNPCWKGYEMIGTKRKGKRVLPNCVRIGGVKKGGAWVIEASTAPSIYFDESQTPDGIIYFSTFAKAKAQLIKQLKAYINDYKAAISYVQSLKG